jgi:hypothetical protein
VMPQAGRRGKPRLRRSFALPAPGLPAWPRLRAEILQNKLARMRVQPWAEYPLQMSKLQAPKGQDSLAQGLYLFSVGQMAQRPVPKGLEA